MASSRRQDSGDWKAGRLSQFLLLVFMITLVAYQPTEGCISVAGADITNCTYGDTTDQSTCEASGCCWDTSITPNCFLYDIPVEGFDVQVEYSLPVVFFNMKADAGTDLVVIITYGDNETIEEVWYADHTQVSSLNITYSDRPATYNVVFAVYNNQGFALVERLVCYYVSVIVGTAEVPWTDISVNPVTTVQFSLTDGDVITLTADMGDNSSIVTEEYASYADVPTSWNYSYVELGQYDVNMTLCNCNGCLPFELVSKVGIPIKGPLYTVSSSAFVNENAIFSFALGNSSETSCLFDFDDGSFSLVYRVFTDEVVNISHAYNTSRVYDTTVYCYNIFNNATDQASVTVIIPVSNLTVNNTFVSVPRDGFYPIGFEAEEGTFVTFSSDCLSRQCGEIILATNLSGVLLLNASVFPGYGTYNMTLFASTDLNSLNQTIGIGVDEVIESVCFETNPIYAAINTSKLLNVSCTTGTRINFQYEFSELPNEIFSILYLDDTKETAMSHTWNVTGTYWLTVTAVNNVSAVVNSTPVFVEYPIPDTNTSFQYSATNVTDVETEVEVIIKLVEGDNDPTNAVADCDFDDGRPNVLTPAYLTVIADDDDFVIGYKYQQFGDFLVNCTLRNNVSRVELLIPVRVGVQISGLNISSTLHSVAALDPIGFVLHVDSGSNLTYSVHYGDDATDDGIQRTSLDWVSPDDTEVSHVYTIPNDAYVVSVTASNAFGTVGPVNLTWTILVAYRLPELQLDTAPYHAVDDVSVTYVLGLLDPNDQPPSSPINCTWTFNDIEQADPVSADQLATGADFTYSHDQSETGNCSTSVQCSNLVSSANASVAFVAEKRIVGLEVAVPEPAANVQEEVAFTLTVSEGSHILFTVDFDDGSEPFQGTQALSNTSTSTTHRYLATGTYDVIISAANHVSNQSMVETLILQDPFKWDETLITVLDYESPVPNKTAIRDDVPGRLNITVDIAPGAILPTDGFVNVTFPSADEAVVFTIDSFPYAIGTPQYAETGDFQLEVVVYNLISNLSYTIPFQVIEYPHAPTVVVPEAPTVYTFPLETFQVNVTYGSHFTVYADFDNGHIENVTVGNERGFHTFNFSGYVYPLPGVYRVKATVSNDFVDLWAEEEVIILDILPNMTLVTNSPLEFVTDRDLLVSTFRLEIAPEDRLPIDCQLHVVFDDGQDDLIKSTSIKDDITWEHTYTSPNYYYVKINVSTMFDYKYFETIMSVQIPLSEVSLTYGIPDQDEELDTYPVPTTLQYVVAHEFGTGANYTWIFIDLKEGSVYHTEVTNDTQITWRMGTSAPYLIQVIADNGLGTPRNASRHLEIVPDGVIAQFDFPPTAELADFVDFDLRLSDEYNRAPYSFDDVCIKFRLGNDFFWISSAEEHCVNLNDPDFDLSSHRVTIQAGSEAYSIRYSFDAAGVTPVYVEVTDKDGRFSKKLTGEVNVTVYCYAPDVSVKPDCELLSGFRADTIFIATENFHFEFHCVATTEVHYEFGLRRYADYTRAELGEELIGAIRSSQLSDGLYIEPLQLDVGYYAVYFVLSMGPAGYDNAELTASAQLDLEVLATDFTVGFRSGIYRQVASRDRVTLTAEVDNPDQPDDVTGFVYTWFCYQYEQESDWAEANVQLPTKADRITIPTNDSGLSAGLGGCFNTGPGMLVVSDDSSNKLTLDTSLMLANLTYAVHVVASKNNKSASSKTRIAVRDGPFVEVDMRCKGSNCFRKSNAADMYMEGNCTECPQEDLTKFNWELKLQNSAKRRRRSTELSVVVQSVQTSLLYISADSLVEGGFYEVFLVTQTPSGLSGDMYYEFYVNFSPRGGTCGSDVTEGNTTTVFTLSCEGWQDEADSLSQTFEPVSTARLTYSFSYFTTSGDERPLAGASVRLPSGDPDKDYAVTVRAYITDMYGLSSFYDFQVKVEPVEGSTLLTDELELLQSESISQFVLSLESNLNTLSVLASEASSQLTEMLESGVFVETSLDSPLSTTSSQEEEIQLQKQEDLLKIIDDVISLYKSVLLSDEVELSAAQINTIVQSLASIPLPSSVQPSTLSSMFIMLASLSDKIDNIQINDDDPESVAMADQLVEGVTNIVSNSLSAASDILVHQAITVESFNNAIFDIPMTEEEQARSQALLEGRETAIEDVKTNTIVSVVSVANTVSLLMMRTTVTTSSVSTETFSATVSAIDPNKDLSEQPLNVDMMNGISSSIVITSPVAPNSMGVATAFDKSAFGVGEEGEISGSVILFKVAASDGSSQITAEFALTQSLMPYDDIKGNCSDSLVMDEDTGMMYMFITVMNHSTYTIELQPNPAEYSSATIYIMADCVNIIECRPNRTYYSYKEELPVLDQVNPWQTSFGNLSGDVYIGIEVTGTQEESSSTPNFCMKNGVSRCREYSFIENTWSQGDSWLNPNSTLGSPTCMMTTGSVTKAFSSGFTVPTVNPIDFAYIFANFAELLKGNPAVFGTVTGVIVVYIVVAVWARRADRKDIEKWSVLPLIGNMPYSRNFYKISVFTGMRRGAGTRSNIYFILSGDLSDSGTRELKDRSNRTFSTGSIRHFTLATEEPLGDLIFLRIWHDNSGEGDHASWFLDKIIVEDLQRKQRYFFLCGRWLAVDEDDGLVDRIMPVAGHHEILRFQNLFFDKARRKLFDDHLWLSVVGRPTRSNFTRLQRLTCILCLLFTTMLANAMWYGRVEVTNDRALKIGPITLSAATILVSVFGSLTVVPINTIIVLLFRKHRPKEWPADDEVIGVNGEKIKVKEGDGAKKKRKWWKEKYPLPYWCAYVAWILAISCTLTGVFFIIMYSLQWGKEKAEAWLSSLVISTFQSVVFIQPVKVILLAAIFALVIKTLDDDEDDIGVRNSNAMISQYEEFTDEGLIKLDELIKRKMPEPPENEKLAEARRKRKEEKEMRKMLHELGFYLLFLLLILFILLGNRSPLLYHSNQSILAQMAGGDLEYFSLTVTNGWKFWEWSRTVLIDNLFFMKHYNGEPGTPRDRQYLSDGINFRVGPLVMRQVRVEPNSCRVLPVMRDVIKQCNDVYSFMEEEKRNFTLNWELDPRDNYTAEELTRVERAFKYKSFTELKTIPYWGTLATYGGGGYVANLGTTKGQASSLLDDLLANNWIDYYTRAVLVEFTVYNPNINMFSYVNFLMESPATGAFLASAKVATFQLFTRLSGMTLVVVACQVIYMILITYFMVREALKFRRLGKDYWKDPWNYVEIIIICLSWGTLAIYLSREVVGRLILNMIMENKEQYMNFALFSYYDEIQWYVIGLIVFMSNLKALRLLRYNKHVSHFSGTLWHASKDFSSFSVTFFVIFMSFTALTYLLFSEYEGRFNTVITTMESLFAMLIGKFDIGTSLSPQRSLSPFVFGFYVVLVYFIAVNMFLAIIGNAYEEVSKNPEMMAEDHRVVDYIKEKTLDYLGLSKKGSCDKNQYLDPLDALNIHLEALDRIVTEDCRAILGFERAAMRCHSSTNLPQLNKAEVTEQDKKRVSRADGPL